MTPPHFKNASRFHRTPSRPRVLPRAPPLGSQLRPSTRTNSWVLAVTGLRFSRRQSGRAHQ